MSRKLFAFAALGIAFWVGGAHACRVPIYPDATFYGMIISPPPGCKDCGRRFVVMDPKSNEPIRMIQLSQIALACYSPNGAIGEVGTLNVQGSSTDKEFMQHSFLVGRKPELSEQWYTNPRR